MTIQRKSLRSIPILCLGATMLAGLAAGCGVEVRPRAPTFQARAVVAPATYSAASQPAPAYSAPPQSQAAPPSQPGYEAMPDDVATAGQYQQSGGATHETAEVVAIGSTLIGRVAKGAPRYYVIDLAVGDTFEVKIYMKPLLKNGHGWLNLKVFEPDEVRLGGIENYIHNETEWVRQATSMTAKQPGRHFIELSADVTAEYKFLLNGKVVATK